MDESAFNSCLDSNKYRQDVEAEREEAQARGVQSTPTLYINGEQLLGAVPFEQLQEVIEAELSKQQ
jgi:protein-disulfide isomerase